MAKYLYFLLLMEMLSVGMEQGQICPRLNFMITPQTGAFAQLLKEKHIPTGLHTLCTLMDNGRKLALECHQHPKNYETLIALNNVFALTANSIAERAAQSGIISTFGSANTDYIFNDFYSFTTTYLKTELPPTYPCHHYKAILVFIKRWVEHIKK